MATYNVESRNGNTVAVPDFAKLNIDGLQIIGDQTTDWNEPYNKNFLALDKKIKAVEDLVGAIGDVDLSVINTSIASLQTELNSVVTELAANTAEDGQDDASLGLLTARVDALVTMMASKVDKVTGKELSTNDYTDLEKTKLTGIAAGAQLNTVTSVAGKMGVITLDVADINGLSDALATSGSNVDLSTVDSDIIPTLNSTYNIGSADKRWKGIYVDEAYLSANTLYIDGIPVIGTDSENIVIKADVDQSITVQTKGLGVTNITSENEVSVSTTGTNADVVVQATGTNSKVKIAGANGIELSSPVSAQSDVAVSGNLTVSGNLVMNGPVFEVNATTVVTKDNIIVVNKGEIGSGVTAGKAGIQVDRGDFSDYQLVFDETTDKFVVGQVGGTFETLATREYVTSVALGSTVDLSGKADINHTHSILDVSGLQNALNDKISYTSANTLDLGEM